MVRVHTYRGRSLTVVFEPSRCIHAAECVRGLPEVFDTTRAPWVQPDAARIEAVRSVVRRCPTGALRIPGEVETLHPTAEIDVLADGPLYCRGRLRLVTGEAVRHEYRMALCRCGVSQNKPFCDGRHRAVRFQDPGAMESIHRPPAPRCALKHLDLTPEPCGPMHAEGPVLIRDAAGRVRYSGTDTFLCRCGASQAKPFCDGSHAAFGFRG